MKRIASLLIAICAIVSCTVIPGSAEEIDTITFYYENDVEVIVEVNGDLTYDQMKHIADTIAGAGFTGGGSTGGDGPQLNPQCAAGNHDITTSYTTSVRHNVYSTSFKCVEDSYIVETCTRIGCFYEVYNLVSSTRINTCHG